MKIILGSQSPRRREIFSYFSLPFEQFAPPFPEESIQWEGDPVKYVTALSKGKADSIGHLFADSIVVTADTVVYREGKIYNKPLDYAEAVASLSELVGRWHSVFTGVTVRAYDEDFTAAEETKVLFNQLSEDQISHYLRHINWKDKAGGYAIQNSGGLIVNRIEGCFYNVMGLPINTTRSLLLHAGIDLWDYL